MKWLLLEEVNGIVSVRLNRPEQKNALNSELIEDLISVFSNNALSQARGIHLSGAGSAFCSGADLIWMRESQHLTREENLKDATRLSDLFNIMKNLPMPVITEVHGTSFGGAMGLLACSDVVVAQPGAKFCFSEVRLGIAPAVISGYILDHFPSSQIRAWMLTGREFTAIQAVGMGLVTEVADNATKWVDSLISAGPQATREFKKLLKSFSQVTRASYESNAIELISSLRSSAEGQEGLMSFLEKRKPSWNTLK